MSDQINFEALRAPFDHADIGWVPIAEYPKGNPKKLLVTPYADARAIQTRLDEVVGPDKWRASYEEGPDGGVLCRLELRCGDVWVAKCDGAENTAVEAVKGGLSNAFKRAAVTWGIGRYLYRIEPQWVECDDKKRFTDPRMPSSAGKNPPNEKREIKAKDPKQLIADRLLYLEFVEKQVEAFFDFIAKTYKVESIDDLPAAKLATWATKMEKQADEYVINKVLDAIGREEAA